MSPIIQDTATFSVKSLGLHKVTATSPEDWKIIHKIILEKLEKKS